MTTFAHELKASYAFMERNFFLTRRYWGWEIAFLVYSVAGALSISLIGADQGSRVLGEHLAAVQADLSKGHQQGQRGCREQGHLEPFREPQVAAVQDQRR